MERDETMLHGVNFGDGVRDNAVANGAKGRTQMRMKRRECCREDERERGKWKEKNRIDIQSCSICV